MSQEKQKLAFSVFDKKQELFVEDEKGLQSICRETWCEVEAPYLLGFVIDHEGTLTLRAMNGAVIRLPEGRFTVVMNHHFHYVSDQPDVTTATHDQPDPSLSYVAADAWADRQ